MKSISITIICVSNYSSSPTQFFSRMDEIVDRDAKL